VSDLLVILCGFMATGAFVCVAIVTVFVKVVAIGWTSIAAADFPSRGVNSEVLASFRARIGMKHYEADGPVAPLRVKARVVREGLVLAMIRSNAGTNLGWPVLFVPWDQVAVVDPDDPHHRGSGMCLHVGGRASVLICIEGELADAIRAALAARVQALPAAPPYR
jgi:hypothetical protein